MNVRIKQVMPMVLPTGWKKEVAKTLGVHRNTVTNALRAQEGEMFERIMKCACNKYGKIVKSEKL